MSYAPIFSEPIPSLLKTSNRTVPNNHSFSKVPKQNGRANGRPRQSRAGNNTDNYSILVHCHLCWNWVWQRPQQFLSRLSQRHKIVFVETIAPDPELANSVARFRKPQEFPNITILTLQFPAWRWSDGAFIDRERRRLVQDFLASPMAADIGPLVQWFYDPMAVTAFAGQMDEVLTVYDCMDELSKFRCAPPEIIEREKKLLKLADVVFTGGRKLFESKSRYNENCHFYGCGVDVEHFGSARKKATQLPPELQHISRPVLGYFGVVDERMDYELIVKLADANPKWSVAIIGPVMKVDPATLPRRGNLHWLGQQPYEKLPAFCKGFDVCLMPFALNEATEFINPTKALEYMATGRPVVSSPVADVVRNFGTVAKIGQTHDEFITLCRQAIEKPEPARIESGLQMAASNSWERIVGELESHIEDALKEAVEA